MRPQADGYASIAEGLIAVYRGANIAVLDDRCLRQGRRILVLRLGDGHSVLLWPERGPVRAEIEAPGLYYSYATADGRGRLELIPTAELERRLG